MKQVIVRAQPIPGAAANHDSRFGKEEEAMRILSLAIMLLAGPAWALPVTTAIKKAMVYPSGAMVFREGKIELEAGENTLIFSDLSSSLLEDSIRVKGEGPGRAMITGLSARTVYLVEPRHPEVERLEKELKRMESRRRDFQGRIRVLEMQDSFLRSLGLGEKSEGIPSPEVLQGTLEFLGNSGVKLDAESANFEVRIENLDLEIAKVKSELERLGGGKPQSRRALEVSVTLEAQKAGEYALELSYMVRSASWRPVYDARGEAAGGKLDLSLRAEVRQQSGEDWPGVELSLSTARPSRGSTPPEPQPWYIDFPAPPAPPRAYAKRAAAPSAGAMMALEADSLDYAAEAEAPVPMEALEASAVDTGTAVVFQVPRPQDIPADGEFHGMLINRREFAGEFEYLALPRLSESVYLQASFVNDQPFPYLPGKINVFNGDDFVGTSNFKGAAPGEKSRLYLGTDERVKVERSLLTEGTEKGGLFRGGTAYRRAGYRIKVENYSPASAVLGVIDQIPVSRAAEIEVSLDKVSPQPLEKWEGEQPGLLKWQLQLSGGQKREITYSFTVKYPADKTVSGL